MSIDFQFLRDCVTALRKGNPANFDMGHWTQGDGYHEGNNWCGTPACVAGHWAARELAGMPLEARKQMGPFYMMQQIERVTGRCGAPSEFGLTESQVAELFSAEGCGAASTPHEAIAYLQDFIVRHGGSIEDPKPLDVAVVPDWNTIATVAQPVAHTTKAAV